MQLGSGLALLSLAALAADAMILYFGAAPLTGCLHHYHNFQLIVLLPS